MHRPCSTIMEVFLTRPDGGMHAMLVLVELYLSHSKAIALSVFHHKHLTSPASHPYLTIDHNTHADSAPCLSMPPLALRHCHCRGEGTLARPAGRIARPLYQSRVSICSSSSPALSINPFTRLGLNHTIPRAPSTQHNYPIASTLPRLCTASQPSPAWPSRSPGSSCRGPVPPSTSDMPSTEVTWRYAPASYPS